MKKTFQLQVENKKPERQLESVKNEIRKYMKRERKKKLPEDAIYWDFKCRFGKSVDEASELKASELTAALDGAFESSWSSCYVEVEAMASMKQPKALDASDETEEEA